jgi:hypothetical protein
MPIGIGHNHNGRNTDMEMWPRLSELPTSFDNSVWCGDACSMYKGGSADGSVVVKAGTIMARTIPSLLLVN